MAYATITDIEARMVSALTEDQERVCSTLLDDAATLIDAWNTSATDAQKKAVSCSMVIRAIGSANDVGVPVGATQGSASAMGYSQSWTIGNGSTGELYLTRTEKKILGVGNSIGSYSPIEELVAEETT